MNKLKKHSNLWYPFTKFSAIENGLPLMVYGKGIYLYDDGGNKYFDAISSWWASNLGHCHPRIVKAIQNQAKKLDHSILGNMSHPLALELAEKLAKFFTKEKRYVFFASDGASAVEAALKIALQYWYNVGKVQKSKIVSLNGAYHGDTLGAVSVAFVPDFHAPFKHIVEQGLQVPAPCCCNCPESDKDVCSVNCFSATEKVIAENAEEIAAVIVEPICQGAAGMRIYSPQYLKKLAELCRKKQILLIVDEVAMGFGRTGKMFAFEHANVDPDIVCLGKGLAAGHLPISATVVKESIYQTFSDLPHDNTFYHGHTFTGNPIACAAAIETLKIYEEQQIVAKAEQAGKLLAVAINAIRNLPGVQNIRSLGMVAAFDLKDKSKTVTGNIQAQIIKTALLKQEILIRPLGNTLYLMPPLITPEKVIQRTVGLLAISLAL